MRWYALFLLALSALALSAQGAAAVWMPDEVGLFVQGFVGSVLISNNILFGFFVFSLVHYTFIWMTLGGTGVAVMSPLMGWIFGVRMPMIFMAGILVGGVYAIAMKTRTLLPGHTWDTTKNQGRYGLFLAGLFLIGAFRSIFFMTGAHRGGTPYPPDPADTASVVMCGIFAALAAIGFGIIMYLTWMPPAPDSFWALFQIQYDDSYKNRYVLFYIVALFLLTTPTAAWDFLVIPPTSWELWQAGLLTLGLIWVSLAILYCVGEFWLRLDKSHFRPDQSLVSYSTFILILAVFLTVLHVYFIVYFSYISSYEEADVAVLIFAVLATLVGIYLAYALRRSGAQRLRKWTRMQSVRQQAAVQQQQQAAAFQCAQGSGQYGRRAQQPLQHAPFSARSQ